MISQTPPLPVPVIAPPSTTAFTAIQTTELKRAQFMKTIDVFVLGPFLLVASAREKNPYFKIGLAIAGVASIAYNLHIYLENRKRLI